MTLRSGSPRFATVLAILMLAACPGPRPQTATEFDKDNLFAEEGKGTSGALRRDLECLQRGRDGECVQRKCTQGPGGKEFDCESYAAGCVTAGYHWAGTKESGVCTEVL